ncbi:hypothetical protein ACTJJ4_03840 [Microbacterium sp. 22195]|uniref:hypothetical protein n=1 Tax=Microbacterium sp. 22195 TaxID=3453891 RepID=UPI003F871C18
MPERTYGVPSAPLSEISSRQSLIAEKHYIKRARRQGPDAAREVLEPFFHRGWASVRNDE